MFKFPQAPLKGIDRARVQALAAPVLAAHGAELVALEWKMERGGWVLRLLVERRGAAEQGLSTRAAALDLESCARISRDISTALDVAELIASRYSLEISSPGVERELYGDADMRRFRGETVRIKLRDRWNGQAVLQGILGDVEGAGAAARVGIEFDGDHADIPLRSIEGARLVFEFRPREKPGKGKSKGKTGPGVKANSAPADASRRQPGAPGQVDGSHRVQEPRTDSPPKLVAGQPSTPGTD
jgi:ribosome maturation factor RimP